MTYTQFGTTGIPLLRLLQPYIEAFKKASSLNENEARLCVYFCILTYKIMALLLIVILVLFGEHGSGKSSIIKVMLQEVY